MNFYYFDRTNQRRGPVNEQQLQTLAMQGIITSESRMETDTGHKGTAGELPGLRFPVAVPPSSVIPPSAVIPPSPPPFEDEGVYVASEAEKLTTKLAKSLSTSPIPMAVAAAVAVVLSLAVLGVLVANVRLPFGTGANHPLKKAEPGDWARYDVTVSANGMTVKGTAKYEIVSKDRKRIKIRMTQTLRGPFGGGNDEVKEEEIDLSLSPQEIDRYFMERGMPDELKNAEIKIGKGKSSKETTLLAGRKFDCVVSLSTLTAIGGKGESFTAVGKEWESQTAPITGTVKSEMEIIVATKEETKELTLSMKLAAFGNDPSIIRNMEVKKTPVAQKSSNSGLEGARMN